MQWLKFGDLCQLLIKFISWSNSTISIAIINFVTCKSARVLTPIYIYIYSSKHLLTAIRTVAQAHILQSPPAGAMVKLPTKLASLENVEVDCLA